ncbi:dienelactone hydrolase family protein [Streptomyces sp. NPDC101237]|uniref:dienelactone hydrolase family protein n=1 Tax=Streptomyces sp. NPDC101237 TaxID=3366139 RepID=UPI0037F24B14
MRMLRGHGRKPDTSALRVRHCPRRPRLAIITLHGGRADGYQKARPWHLAALRMRPVLRSAASAVSLDDAVLAQVRYRHRGWNQGDPLQDTYRALDELERLAGPVPALLIGHSMGGRAALRAASHPRVRAVVALAPWLPPGEPTGHLRGKRAVVLHGTSDRITSAEASAEYVRRARTQQTSAGIILVSRGDHAMLRRSSLWHRTVAELVGGLLHPGGQLTGRAAESSASPEPILL